MPFIPHTENDIADMLKSIGVATLDDLFDEIPQSIQLSQLAGCPEGFSEPQLNHFFKQRFSQQPSYQCYLGAGAYEHHIPAAVWDIANRGEFLTAYTPYQAEASQGTLQLLFEYQTMMSQLMAMEVSNASLYDGATSLVEAVLMAVRLKKIRGTPNIAVPTTVHPHYRQVLHSLLSLQQIQISEILFDKENGIISLPTLEQQHQEHKIDVLVIPFPNFLGQCERVDELTDWAHQQEILVIAVVNPMAVSWLKPPGEWGQKGADLACGEGQPLGIPLNGGGPYFGFLCCAKQMIRQLPGRLVAQTQDSEGRIGFTLTLQAREQHIRRGKATSNICTNQGLMVTAASIYLSLFGVQGLQAVAQTCHQNAHYLVEKLSLVQGVTCLYPKNYFHEVIIQLPANSALFVKRMLEKNIAPGVELSNDYPEFSHCLLICVTETKTLEQLDDFVAIFCETLKEMGGGCRDHF